MVRKELIGVGIVLLVGITAATLLSFSEKKASIRGHDTHHGHGHDSHGHSHDGCDSKGPNGGKVLTEAEFALEVVIYEKGGPAHFRMYPSYNRKPLDPKEVTLSVALERLGDRVDRFDFVPANGFLYSKQEIEEPHSFFIKIVAEWKGEKFDWEYSQYEGRLTVPHDLAAKMGFEAATAGPGNIRSIMELPGEVVFNADMLAHVVPRVPGVVLEVRKNLGDTVQKGEIVAIIDSRELGEARTKYLVAMEREKLANYNYERVQRLWESNAVAEKEFLTAKKTFLEERIEFDAAGRKLMALGLTEEDVRGITEAGNAALTHYLIRAPFDGVVTRKHISKGEWVKEDAEIYVIADLSTVWVEITVYARDLDAVHMGQAATVKADASSLEAVGTVSYVGPLLGEDTRTAKARVVIPNTDRKWRPGLFARVELVQHNWSVPLVIRNEAIQTHQNKRVVFVQYDDQYEARPVVIGKVDRHGTEVLKGLSAGERYVTRNSFILKAELGKAGMSHEH